MRRISCDFFGFEGWCQCRVFRALGRIRCASDGEVQNPFLVDVRSFLRSKATTSRSLPDINAYFFALEQNLHQNCVHE